MLRALWKVEKNKRICGSASLNGSKYWLTKIQPDIPTAKIPFK
jgi:hypothetical protein